MPLIALLTIACSPSPLEDPATEVWIAGEVTELSWDAERGGDLQLVNANGAQISLAEGVDGAGKLDWTVPLEAAAGRGYEMLLVRDDAEATPIATSVTLGALIGFTWNGSQEELFRLDPRTGNQLLLGTVGDLESWNAEVALDYVHSTMYVWGVDAAGRQELHALDLFSGAYQGEVPVGTMVQGWQVNSLGELISLRWNGAVEELIRIDPSTGVDTVIGVVGDLHHWAGQTAIDVDSDTLYVAGADASDRWYVYEVDAINGTLLRKSPAPQGLLGAQLTNRGTLVYSEWTGAAQVLMELDPSTGSTTTLGPIGDLQWWSGQTALDVANDTLYVFGNDGASDTLYVMDVATGALLYETPLQGHVSAPRLVF
ncbi:MAG: hypothetical protein H6740_29255 [Alphaproteobacteria bacterium]|nr:hypothetical protein [Alphaproteobacteria bacterium]